jgi:hypothetical protein
VPAHFNHQASQALLKVSNTILTRNASSILSRLSCLPTEVSLHPLLFTLPTDTPTAIRHRDHLPLRVQQHCQSLRNRAPQCAHCVLGLSQGGNYALPRRYTGAAGDAGREVTGDLRYGRGGMKRRLWEGTTSHCWRRRTWIGSDFGVVAFLATRFPSLRGKVRVYPSSLRHVARNFLRQADLLTAVTVKDSAPQGLNQALCSSFAHVTQVHLARQLRSLSEFLYINTRPLRVVYPFVTGRPYVLIFNRSANPPPPFVSRSPPVSLRPACAR